LKGVPDGKDEPEFMVTVIDVPVVAGDGAVETVPIERF
jgi:hypothetical protein